MPQFSYRKKSQVFCFVKYDFSWGNIHICDLDANYQFIQNFSTKIHIYTYTHICIYVGEKL